MNNKKAKQIRKIIPCTPAGVRVYKDYITKRTKEIPGQGTVEYYEYTKVSDDNRRVYQLAKKIYRLFKVLPKITEVKE